MAGESGVNDGCAYPRGFSQANTWPWPLIPARDLVSLQYGRALTAADRVAGTVPVYGTNGQCGWHNKPLADGPGIILGRKGQGPLGVEWCSTNFWVIDTAYYISPLRPDIHLPFVYHLVKYIGLNHLKDGTSNPTLSRDSFGSQLLPLPPLPEQKRIAHVLGTLDDKIELNRRMNATLEAMSRAIFKSWFVDFDPVRQKAAGKQPVGMDAQTAALFPDSFEDSEIGEVPRGWPCGTLSEYADLNPESWSRASYPSEVRYVDLSSTKSGEIATVEAHSRDSAPSRAQRILRLGDTIFGTVRPGNESFALVDSDGLTGSTGFAVLRPKRRESREYVYLATTMPENVDRLAHLADGGAYPAVQPEVVAETPLAAAPPTVVAAFSKCTCVCFNRIATNRVESRTLAALRDALLPKLLSGEIRVPEAETAVEEAVR